MHKCIRLSGSVGMWVPFLCVCVPQSVVGSSSPSHLYPFTHPLTHSMFVSLSVRQSCSQQVCKSVVYWSVERSLGVSIGVSVGMSFGSMCSWLSCSLFENYGSCYGVVGCVVVSGWFVCCSLGWQMVEFVWSCVSMHLRVASQCHMLFII